MGAWRWTARVTDQWQPAGELQTYTADPSNFFYDDDGRLVIAVLRHATNDRPFTSARLRMPMKFHFGRYAARVRIPAGAGVWPAFWLLGQDDLYGWPECGEIDIMEAPAGPDTLGEVHQGVHCPSSNGGSACEVGVPPSRGRWDDDFHVYAVLWRRGSVEFSIDGKPTGAVTRAEVEAAGGRWVFDDRPMSPIVNVAVGGWAGTPGDWSRQEMVIDWVKAGD